MNSSPQIEQMEQRLSSQLQVCKTAHQMASFLANKSNFDVMFQVELGRLDVLTKQIASGQVELSSMLGEQGIEKLPTPELRGLAARLGEAIARLLPLFDLIEKRVQSAKSRLHDDNGHAVQARRMQNAYSNSTS